MNEDDRKQAAALLETPVFVALIDELEADAIDQCLAAKPQDDVSRAAWAAEARAIRNLRHRLQALAQPVTRKSVPA